MTRHDTLEPVNEVLLEVQNATELRFLTNHVSFADDLLGDILNDQMSQTFRTIAYDMAGNQVYRITELNTLFCLDSWSPYSQEESEDTMADAIMNGINIRTNDGRTIEIPPFSTISELRMRLSIRGNGK